MFNKKMAVLSQVLVLMSTGVLVNATEKSLVRESALSVHKKEPMSKEKAEAELLKHFKETLAPKVDNMIERVKQNMKNGTLYPKNKENTSVLDLGRAQDPKAIPVLTEVLAEYKNTENDSVNARVDAASALGMIGDRSAIPALKQAMLDKSEYGRVRTIAAVSLIRLGETEEVRQFVKTQFKLNGTVYAYAITELLGKGADNELKEIAKEHYIKRTEKSDDPVRVLQAADTLVKLGENEIAFKVAKKLFENSVESIIREGALGILRKIGDDKSINLLEEGANDKDFPVKRTAVRNLKELSAKGNKKARLSLKRIAETNSSVSIKNQAGTALKETE